MPPRQQTTAQQVALHIKATYLGSQDIEIADSIDFCAFIEKIYGGDAQGMVRLKASFQKLEDYYSRTMGWHPPPPSRPLWSKTQRTSRTSQWPPGRLAAPQDTV